MLKTILSISGKPGLYKLISQGKNMLIVESISAEKKRFPAYGNEKIISLADIAMYTNDAEVPLRDVLVSATRKAVGSSLLPAPMLLITGISFFFACMMISILAVTVSTASTT